MLKKLRRSEGGRHVEVWKEAGLSGRKLRDALWFSVPRDTRSTLADWTVNPASKLQPYILRFSITGLASVIRFKQRLVFARPGPSHFLDIFLQRPKNSSISRIHHAPEPTNLRMILFNSLTNFLSRMPYQISFMWDQLIHKPTINEPFSIVD